MFNRNEEQAPVTASLEHLKEELNEEEVKMLLNIQAFNSHYQNSMDEADDEDNNTEKEL
jgi:hypothetical protein